MTQRWLKSVAAILVMIAGIPWGAAGQDVGHTRVVVLGVEHAGQLFAEDYRPAVLRAWLARVDPDGIAIEVTPDRHAAGDFHGFTYEIQEILLPWARARGVPLHPFDWEPDRAEQHLGFGFDLQETPLIRPHAGWGAFVEFPEQRVQTMTLFLGDDPVYRERVADWSGTPGESIQGEMARRLFLYRTILQARRIEGAARQHRGGTLAVVVGAMHQADLERHLRAMPGIEMVSASSYGHPSPEEVRLQDRTGDMLAVAWTNLFGVGSLLQPSASDWVAGFVHALETEIPEPEFRILALKLEERRGHLTDPEALHRWLALVETTPRGQLPSWTGRIDIPRLDSDFDPFAALSLRQRASHEASRVAAAMGQDAMAIRYRDEVSEALNPIARMQYLAYWQRFVGGGEAHR